MAKAKFYAVKIGKTPGIYNTWEACKAQVDGVSGATYKSFGTAAEASAYMGWGNGENVVRTSAEKEAVAYVDGSYNDATKQFSYGVVFFAGDKEKQFSQCVEDDALVSMRNVAGEIKGAEAAMRYAIEKGYKKLTIYHDYEGIAKWCLGDWKTNKEGTIAYKRYYDSIKDKLDVKFVKVKGHSGDRYNDLADKLAKEALGI